METKKLTELPFDEAAREVVSSLENDETLVDLRTADKTIKHQRKEILDEITLQMGALFEEEGFAADTIQVDAFVADTRQYLSSGNGLTDLNDIYQTARGGDVVMTKDLLMKLYEHLRDSFEASFSSPGNASVNTSGPEVVHGVVHSTRAKFADVDKPRGASKKRETARKRESVLDPATYRKLGYSSAPVTDFLGTNTVPINGVAAGVFKSDEEGKKKKKEEKRKKAS